MSELYLYTSNRLEFLSEILAGQVGTQLDPMQPETILVQSGGMQRWVSMQLARRLGVCANAQFPFPVGFAYDLCRRLLPDLPREYRLDKENMLWRIVAALPGLLDEPGFELPRRYLSEDRTFKLIQLAEKIAYHFDQYLLFRPLWSRQWEQGLPGGDMRQDAAVQAEQWQMRLWQEVAQGHEQEHRAALLRRAMEVLNRPNAPEGLPARVSLFGISTLPPSYLDLFTALGNHVSVSLYLLSPCRQYWGDLAGQREQVRAYRSGTETGQALPDDDSTPLHSLGALGRDFQNLIIDQGIEELALYQPITDPRTMLQYLHRDLLDLTPAGKPVEIADNSIQVHCCHSPMREMEVVRDLVLDLLQHDPTLEPGDILIMNPDIETYAPCIQAVFGGPEEPVLPYAISDRRPSRATQPIRLFLELLAFGRQRFEASRVLALLEAPLIRRRLDLDEEATSRIVQWVQDTGIRWGLDKAFRDRAGQGQHDHNTWTSGLSRLFLGYMTGADHGLVRGTAPCGPLGSADQVLLGKLAAFLDNLQQLWTDLNTPATAVIWQQRLLQTLETFFPQDKDTDETLLTIRKAVTALAEAMAEHLPEQEIDGRCLQYLLQTRLDESGGESAFLSSGLTFCGLKPMRAIPFRVIIVSGLSGTAFPRQEIQPGFDLLAASPRRGDRSLREDDRYLFLESIISARETLILTYPGLSLNDTGEAPPSVLLSELLDYLDGRYTVRGTKPSETLVIRHRLQAFHPEYFRTGSGLFSYSRLNCSGARALCGLTESAPFFQSETEPRPVAELTLQELENFLIHPVRSLLNRLGLYPTEADADVLDEEPLADPAGLDGYAIKTDLLDMVLQDEHAALETYLDAWQVLPPGPAGRDCAGRSCREIREQAQRIREITAGRDTTTHDIRLDLPELRLSGRITAYGDRLVTWRPARLKGADMLRLWVRTLAAAAAGTGITGTHLGSDDACTFSPPDGSRARDILSGLSALYRQGQTMPIPLFPRASYAFAAEMRTSADPDKALARAYAEWQGNQHISAEQDDAHLALVYRDTEPDWNAFMEVTQAVFGPMLEARHDH